MKKRDSFWVIRILQILLIVLVFFVISICNIVRFNSSYMQEEREELQVSKRQIVWAVQPILEKKNYSLLQEYCNDFQDEDIEFRIFDENKKLLATSNLQNDSELLKKDSDILNEKYSSFKLYRRSLKDKKIGIREKIFVDGHKYYIELTVSQADVIKSIYTAQKSILIFIGICILLLIFSLMQVFYTLRTTFNKLEDSVIEVANGNLDANIEVPKLDLLKELTLSIKKMTMRLKTQISRLKQLEQYKSNFLQNVTHEIKTPITAINSAIELLQAGDMITDNDRECFDIIKFQVQTINKLVNDILYLSEIEVEKTNEQRSFFHFNLNKAVENLISSFNYSNVKINFIQFEQIDIFANKELLTTAISNLLTNAIKYSQSDEIDITLDKFEHKIRIVVEDFGIGIEQEHIEHIFERFYRVDKMRSRKLGGTGLGLAIVKNIVELHNGEVSVESSINKGTKFTITLPDG